MRKPPIIHTVLTACRSLLTFVIRYRHRRPRHRRTRRPPAAVQLEFPWRAKF